MHLPPLPLLSPARSGVLPCHVTRPDIEAMEYWLNEAPMSEPGRHNAIVFALRRVLGPTVDLRLGSDPRSGVAFLFLDDVSVPLPEPLASWWARALTGHPMEPVSAFVFLPDRSRKRPGWSAPRSFPSLFARSRREGYRAA